tara:strand:- start:347 stop:691 length:345 start_codon:yes stop_codon:yes gene_type:complete
MNLNLAINTFAYSIAEEYLEDHTGDSPVSFFDGEVDISFTADVELLCVDDKPVIEVTNLMVFEGLLVSDETHDRGTEYYLHDDASMALLHAHRSDVNRVALLSLMDAIDELVTV